ncbi:MAG: ROK family protein [Clostridiales bacterium]|jgi:predicted NBD/HSP70 family sugar kinase|nr:ROK family protein [Clostridiales bacterium]
MSNPVSRIKARHRRLTFNLLSERKEVSRVEIGKKLGVSLQTAMKIMDYFTDYGLASHIGGIGTHVGRKPQIYSFNENAAHIISAVNEGSVLRVGILNLACETLAEETAELRGSIRSMLVEQPCEIAERLLERLIKEGRQSERLLGMAMCLPGVVDDEQRCISFAPNLINNASYQIGDLLDEAAERMHTPVMIENDVNASVYGEFVYWNTPDLAFIAIGSGVGMGLVLDGKMRRGPNFTAGEIGMMPCGDPATLRNVEDLINLDALKRKFGFDRQFGIQSLNPDARAQMLDAISDVVGSIIATSAAMLDVSDFVLGGITADLLGEELLEATRRKVSIISPLTANLHDRRLSSPALVGAAKKIMDAYVPTLLSLDSEKQ